MGCMHLSCSTLRCSAERGNTETLENNVVQGENGSPSASSGENIEFEDASTNDATKLESPGLFNCHVPRSQSNLCSCFYMATTVEFSGESCRCVYGRSYRRHSAVSGPNPHETSKATKPQLPQRELFRILSCRGWSHLDPDYWQPR